MLLGRTANQVKYCRARSIKEKSKNMSTGLNNEVTREMGSVTKKVSLGINASGQVQTARCLLGCLKGKEKTECQRFEVWGLNAKGVA